MFEELIPIVFLAAVVAVTLGLAKIITDGLTRRHLIRAGATPEVAQAVAAATRQDPDLHASLKWGLVIGAIGLALVLVQFLPYQPDQPIVAGLILLGAAGGLLAYYAAARRMVAR